jgi:hypothetical protein
VWKLRHSRALERAQVAARSGDQLFEEEEWLGFRGGMTKLGAIVLCLSQVLEDRWIRSAPKVSMGGVSALVEGRGSGGHGGHTVQATKEVRLGHVEVLQWHWGAMAV